MVKDSKILDLFKILEWPDIEFNNKDVFVLNNGRKEPLLSINNKQVELFFYWYDFRNHEYNLRTDIESIKFDVLIDIKDFLNINEREYKIKLIYIIKNILNLKKNSDISKIELTRNKKDFHIDVKNKVLKIYFKKYQEIFNEARDIDTKTRRSMKAHKTYLINLSIEKFLKKSIKKMTLISPGDINFTIQRLNLQTKKKKTDFKNYVNKDDVTSIESIVKIFIKNKMFNNNFLTKLDNYFIRERLEDVINLGKKILSLSSSNLKTKQAEKVIFRISKGGKKIKQLETLWQKYFEDYLLFLLFSYKEIFPKIKLTDIEGDKKYPDFIGVNHYNGIDVIEIKTHLKNALVYDANHKNFAFSPELSKAIIQTMNYMDAVIHMNFKNPKDKEIITNSSIEENLNRPRGIIIISSYDKLVSRCKESDREKIIRDFTKLRNSVHNIEILTFDEILNIADDYIKNIIDHEELM